MAHLTVEEQINELKVNPLQGVSINTVRGRESKWRIIVDGPNDSVYNGCKFTLHLEDLPDHLPSLKFTSGFVHPRVHADGQVDFVRGAEDQPKGQNDISLRQTLINVLTFFLTPASNSPLVHAQIIQNIKESNNYWHYLRRYDELFDLHEKPVKGIHIITVNNNFLRAWKFIIFGDPRSDLFARSYFKGILQFPSTYPYEAPEVYFYEYFHHPWITEAQEMQDGRIRYYVSPPPLKIWTKDSKLREVVESIPEMMNISADDSTREILADIVLRSRDDAQRDTSYVGGFPIPETIEDYNILSIVRFPFADNEKV